MTEHKINNIIVQFGLLCEIYHKFKAGSHMTIITSNYFRTSDRVKEVSPRIPYPYLVYTPDSREINVLIKTGKPD